ncbi:hypothetical protein ACQKNB_18560 [Lysinibacillus xylanilyticus]|uniref:hypothetical protein n=1 Tax=Lysinibacillus xylanilyticus TaxID=582475 RepID=UPI003D001EB5
MRDKIAFIIQFTIFYLTIYLGVLFFTNLTFSVKLMIFIPELIFLLSLLRIISEKFSKKMDRWGSSCLIMGLIFLVTMLSIVFSLIISMGLLILIEFKDVKNFFDIFQDSELTAFANYILIFIGITIVISYYLFKIMMYYFWKIKYQKETVLKVNDKHVKMFNAGTVIFGFVPTMTSLLISSMEKSEINLSDNIEKTTKLNDSQIFSITTLNNEVNQIIFVIFFTFLIPYLYFLFNEIPKNNLDTEH